MPLAAEQAGPPRSPDKDKPAPAETAEAMPRRIEEGQPPLYYLPDSKGNLQAVPGFTLEDFETLYKIKYQLLQGDPRPRYSLQEMLAEGSVNAAGQAELKIQFRILVREDQWTRDPSPVGPPVLREPAQYEGSGEHFLSFEGEGEGYVAWIHGAADKPHYVTLKMLVPLTAMGQETRLRLLMPRATASELKLKVPYRQGGGQGLRRRDAANARRRRQGQGNGTDRRRPQRRFRIELASAGRCDRARRRRWRPSAALRPNSTAAASRPRPLSRSAAMARLSIASEFACRRTPSWCPATPAAIP